MEGGGGHLELVEVDGLDVLVQVEGVQLGQKAGDVLLAARTALAVEQPAAQPVKAHSHIGQRLRVAGEQAGQDGHVLGRVLFPGDGAGHGSGELRRVSRAATAVAEAEDGGGVVVQVPAEPADADVQHGQQQVEVAHQQLGVRLGKVLRGQKGVPYRRFRQLRQPPFRCQPGDALTELPKSRCVGVGEPLAGAVPAEGGGGDAGGGAEVFGETVQLLDVGVQLCLKFHRSSPRVSMLGLSHDYTQWQGKREGVSFRFVQ